MNSEKYKWKVWDTPAFPDGGSWEFWASGEMIGLVTHCQYDHRAMVVKCSNPNNIEYYKSMRQGALELVRHHEEGS